MSTEQALEYNGPLSTYVEWDAALYGAPIGLLLSIPRVRRDICREPSKFIGSILFMAVAGMVLRQWRGVDVP